MQSKHRASVLFDIDENDDDFCALDSTNCSMVKPLQRSRELRTETVSSSPEDTTFHPVLRVAPPAINSNSEMQPDEEPAAYDFQSAPPFDQQPPQTGARPRVRSRKLSAYTSAWSFCGMSFSNVVLRALVSLMVVPVVIFGLRQSPGITVALLGSVVMCIGTYEYSWLAFRIHHQLYTTFTWYETKRRPGDNDDRNDESGAFTFDSAFTHSLAGPYSMQGMAPVYRETFDDPGQSNTRERARACTLAPSPLDMLDFEPPPGLLSSLANACFSGNVWLTRMVITIPLTAVWSVGSIYVFNRVTFPVAAIPALLTEEKSAFFWIVNFVTSLCVLSTPNWRAAVSLVLQKIVFSMLLLNTLSCPITTTTDCSVDLPLHATQLFLMGAMAVVLLRTQFAVSSVDVVVSTCLDLLGYVFLSGNAMLFVGLVDTDDSRETFADVVLLMLAVLWIAQVASHCCDAIMFHFRLKHMRLFPARLVLKYNIEATICAVVFGIVTMFVGAELLSLPGNAVAKFICALSGVLLGRLGSLFITLVKKAAGVRYSGRMLPGFGGVLDAVSSLLLATLAFVKYYVYVRVLQEEAASSSANVSGSNSGQSVDFSFT